MNKKMDKEEVLISIIIGIYNGEKYLNECLDSVLGQDYTNLEVILIDDGSTDKSGDIADEYAVKDDRVTVIHQKNSGVSVSRNNAINISHGKYICIVDQDDCLSEDYVSYFYNLIVKYGAEIALTRYADKYLKTPHKDKKVYDRTEIWSGEKTVEEMLYHKIIIAPWNKMISRDLIVKNEVEFNKDFFGGEGFAFSIECFLNAERVVVGRRRVYHYRLGNPESGASKFRMSTIKSSIDAQKYIRTVLPKKVPALTKAWYFSNWHTHCDCMNIMVGCRVTEQYRDVYQRLKHVCRGEALCALKAPISAQQKLRGILFIIDPYFAAKFINYFRLRKFGETEE